MIFQIEIDPKIFAKSGILTVEQKLSERDSLAYIYIHVNSIIKKTNSQQFWLKMMKLTWIFHKSCGFHHGDIELWECYQTEFWGNNAVATYRVVLLQSSHAMS